MQKIIPFLWFDGQAEAAAELYTSSFDGGKVTHVTPGPGGKAMWVSFDIAGHTFYALNGGPHFSPNPSMSFFVNFDSLRDLNAKEHLDPLWEKLSAGGKVLMPLQEYPFSKWYGWVEDTYGISWQLILTNPTGEPRPTIVPSLLFTNDVCGKAEEATDFYTTLFKDSKRGALARYPGGMEPDKEGTLMFTDFMLAGQWFAAMDSAHEHKFNFTEGLSLFVDCGDQQEVDYFWNALTANGGQESQCGWLKDKYGLSWQVIPKRLSELLGDPDTEKAGRVMQAMLKMKKIDIAGLQKAYDQA